MLLYCIIIRRRGILMNTIKAVLVFCSVVVLFSCASSTKRIHQHCINKGLTPGTERFQECYEKRIVEIRIIYAKRAAERAERQEERRKRQEQDQKRLEQEQKRLDKEDRKEEHRQVKDERAERRHEALEQKRLEHEQKRLDKEDRKAEHRQVKDERKNKPKAEKKGNNSQKSSGAASKGAKASEVPGPATPSGSSSQMASGSLMMPGSGSSNVCIVNKSGSDAKFFVNGTLRKLRNGAKMSLAPNTSIKYTSGGKKHSYVLAEKSDCYEIKMVGGTSKIQGAKNKKNK